MQQYTLKDARNRHGEIFDKAAALPILLTKQSRPSHVVMLAEAYQQLIAKLEELEDRLLGQQAQTALSQSRMVGVEEFTLAMKRLANGEA